MHKIILFVLVSMFSFASYADENVRMYSCRGFEGVHMKMIGPDYKKNIEELQYSMGGTNRFTLGHNTKENIVVWTSRVPNGKIASDKGSAIETPLYTFFIFPYNRVLWVMTLYKLPDENEYIGTMYSSVPGTYMSTAQLYKFLCVKH